VDQPKSVFQTTLRRVNLWRDLIHRQIHRAKGLPPVTALVLAVLLLTLTLGGPGQIPPALAAPAAQAVRVRAAYELNLFGPSPIELCVGQTESISVHVVYVVTRRDPSSLLQQNTPYWAPGEIVSAGARDSSIVDIDPPTGSSGASPLDYDFALSHEMVFTITAKQVGSTVITFRHTRSLLMGLVPALQLAPSVDVPVTVGLCYEAYSSGLGLEFTAKDICGLESPFRLSAHSELGILTEKSQVMRFTPDPQDSTHTHGQYAAIDGITVAAAGCTLYTSGSYDVTFYNESRTEGDIAMVGPSSMVCEGSTVFSDVTDFHVAFRAIPSGGVCVESVAE
jgi:hypothetical protein